jgi:hypothetical protein
VSTQSAAGTITREREASQSHPLPATITSEWRMTPRGAVRFWLVTHPDLPEAGVADPNLEAAICELGVRRTRALAARREHNRSIPATPAQIAYRVFLPITFPDDPRPAHSLASR